MVSSGKRRHMTAPITDSPNNPFLEEISPPLLSSAPLKSKGIYDEPGASTTTVSYQGTNGINGSYYYTTQVQTSGHYNGQIHTHHYEEEVEDNDDEEEEYDITGNVGVNGHLALQATHTETTAQPPSLEHGSTQSTEHVDNEAVTRNEEEAEAASKNKAPDEHGEAYNSDSDSSELLIIGTEDISDFEFDDFVTSQSDGNMHKTGNTSDQTSSSAKPRKPKRRSFWKRSFKRPGVKLLPEEQQVEASPSNPFDVVGGNAIRTLANEERERTGVAELRYVFRGRRMNYSSRIFLDEITEELDSFGLPDPYALGPTVNERPRLLWPDTGGTNASDEETPLAYHSDTVQDEETTYVSDAYVNDRKRLADEPECHSDKEEEVNVRASSEPLSDQKKTSPRYRVQETDTFRPKRYLATTNDDLDQEEQQQDARIYLPSGSDVGYADEDGDADDEGGAYFEDEDEDKENQTRYPLPTTQYATYPLLPWEEVSFEEDEVDPEEHSQYYDVEEAHSSWLHASISNHDDHQTVLDTGRKRDYTAIDDTSGYEHADFSEPAVHSDEDHLAPIPTHQHTDVSVPPTKKRRTLDTISDTQEPSASSTQPPTLVDSPNNPFTVQNPPPTKATEPTTSSSESEGNTDWVEKIRHRTDQEEDEDDQCWRPRLIWPSSC